MHSKKKGISSTVIPFRRSSPKWSSTTLEKLTPLICQLAKKGLVPSQIGIYLRDNKGIAQTKNLTGKKIIRILKLNKLAPEIPEDLYFRNKPLEEDFSGYGRYWLFKAPVMTTL